MLQRRQFGALYRMMFIEYSLLFLEVLYAQEGCSASGRFLPFMTIDRAERKFAPKREETGEPPSPG